MSLPRRCIYPLMPWAEMLTALWSVPPYSRSMLLIDDAWCRACAWGCGTWCICIAAALYGWRIPISASSSRCCCWDGGGGARLCAPWSSWFTGECARGIPEAVEIVQLWSYEWECMCGCARAYGSGSMWSMGASPSVGESGAGVGGCEDMPAKGVPIGLIDTVVCPSWS